MHVVAAGISHHTTPVEVRERVAFLASKLTSAARLLRQREGVYEAALLSTCNRTEAYIVTDDPQAGTESVVSFWSVYHGVPVEEITPHLYVFAGTDAARHLFRVAAGLDSMVVGEPQILGQVRDAFIAAQAGRCTGPFLNALFRHAITTGRRVRRETAVGRGAFSVPGAAVAMARKLCGDLKGRRVLVVGAGDMAELTVRSLVASGCGSVTVCNRTLENARPLAEAFGGLAIRFDELETHLRESDILVTSTGAPHPVIEPGLVAAAVRGRQKPLMILDIAVPRDVDPAVAGLAGVHLLNIDDLKAANVQTRAERRSEIAQAEAIVAEEVDKFDAWLRSLRVAPLITALRSRAEAVVEEEWRRALPRLASLPPPQREAMRVMLTSIVNRLLHGPIVRLKEIARRDDATYVEAARTLFDLKSSPSDRDGSLARSSHRE